MLIHLQFVTLLPFLPQIPKKVGQVVVIQRIGTKRDYLRLASRSRGEYLRTHFKNMREVAAALRGKPGTRMVYCCERLTVAATPGLKLTKAYQYLGDVKEHKQVIPFRRFNGGVGRASQAKQFGATQGVLFGWVVIGASTASDTYSALSGRWPEKSVKFILRLLKNAEANADTKSLDLEELYIKNIVVQQAPVCLLNSNRPPVTIY